MALSESGLGHERRLWIESILGIAVWKLVWIFKPPEAQPWYSVAKQQAHLHGRPDEVAWADYGSWLVACLLTWSDCMERGQQQQQQQEQTVEDQAWYCTLSHARATDTIVSVVVVDASLSYNIWVTTTESINLTPANSQKAILGEAQLFFATVPTWGSVLFWTATTTQMLNPPPTIYIYIYIHIYTYIHACICVHVYVCLHMYVFLLLRVCVCVYVRIRRSICLSCGSFALPIYRHAICINFFVCISWRYIATITEPQSMPATHVFRSNANQAAQLLVLHMANVGANNNYQ